MRLIDRIDHIDSIDSIVLAGCYQNINKQRTKLQHREIYGLHEQMENGTHCLAWMWLYRMMAYGLDAYLWSLADDLERMELQCTVEYCESNFHRSAFALVMLNFTSSWRLPVGSESPRLNCGRTLSSVKIRLALPPATSGWSSSSAGRFNGTADKF